MTYLRDVLPAFAGHHTFARCPRGNVDDLRPGMVAVVGVLGEPPEGTERAGTREAPAAIRAASVQFISHLEVSGTLVDALTGRTLRWPSAWNMVDLGDIDTAGGMYGTLDSDIHRVQDAILERGAIPLILGGDPAISVIANRVYQEEDQGLLCVWPEWGGAADEYPVAVIGAQGQFHHTWARELEGAPIVITTAAELREAGADVVCRKAFDRLAGLSGVHLSVDIGLVDLGYSAGTPEARVTGVTPRALLDVMIEAGNALPLIGADFSGVAPALDARGRTEALVARAAIELIALRVFGTPEAAA